MSRIDRTGVIAFHDATLHITEEGLSAAHDWNEQTSWEKRFKKDVFTRVVQQLNRLGWTVGPNTYIFTGNNSRYCRKGDLRADLIMSGRCIKLEMFQNVNAPKRPDHGGRYEFDKEMLMPYVMRLEMQRTRNRIRAYLLNIFSDYTFKSDRADGRSNKCGFFHLNAIEWIQACYESSWHFKGDATTYNISDYNRKSADGLQLAHFDRVWFFDRKGRLNTGIAYYNINNMWWVAMGAYAVTNVSSFELFKSCPANPRVKRNSGLRRKRLEKVLADAIASMKFERAAVIRDIVFPQNPELFVVWHNEHNLYHCSGFSGYTADQSKAGKFTSAEVRNWNHAPNKIIPVVTAEAVPA